MGKGKSPVRTRSGYRGNPRGLHRGNLKFPLNTHGDVNAKVSFQAIEVIPPQFDFNFQEPKSAEEIKDNGIDGIIRRSVKSISGQAVPQKISPIQGSKVDLFLPISYQVTDGFQYDQAQLGLAGAATAGALQAGRVLRRDRRAAERPRRAAHPRPARRGGARARAGCVLHAPEQCALRGALEPRATRLPSHLPDQDAAHRADLGPAARPLPLALAVALAGDAHAGCHPGAARRRRGSQAAAG